MLLSMFTDAEWGTVPDWLAGAGAVVAVVFAGMAAKAALRTNIQQGAQLSHLENAEIERIESRERAQAKRVAVWIVLDSAAKPEVYCYNASELPIYNASIICVSPLGTTRTFYACKSPDAEAKRMNRPTEILRCQATNSSDLSNDDEPDWPSMRDAGTLRSAIVFLDAEGRWWIRDVMGKLQPATDGTCPDGALEFDTTA